MNKRILIIFLILFSMMIIVGCSNDENNDENNNNNAEANDGGEETVHLYTSESQDQVSEMMNQFEKEHPDINVDVFRTGTEELIAKLEAEISSGEIKADMVWFADIDYFNTLAEEDQLEEYDAPNAEELDEDFKYEDGKYYEVRQIFNVLAYNTTKVDDPITSWEDMLRDDLKGNIAVADPDYSGAAFLTLATLADNDDIGIDYYKSLKDNEVKFEQGNGGLASKIASGEYHAVSIVDFMAVNAKNEGSPVEVVWPEEGAVMIPTPVGIIKDSEVTEASEQVMDYLLSEENQELFSEQGYIPVNPNVESPENAPDVEDVDIMPFDPEYLQENREKLNEEYKEIFG